MSEKQSLVRKAWWGRHEGSTLLKKRSKKLRKAEFKRKEKNPKEYLANLQKNAKKGAQKMKELWKDKTFEEFHGKKKAKEIRKKNGKARRTYLNQNPEIMRGENAIALGHVPTEEWKKDHSERMRDEGNPNWQNGKSFEPYSFAFNKRLKYEIRLRDGFICQFCGNTENGKAFIPHHIDYDKKNCIESNLILLCRSCNTKANFNREKWQLLFEILQEVRL